MVSINDTQDNDTAAPMPEVHRSMHNLHTLMVEPSIPQQKLIREQFERQGIIDITTVDSGTTALASMAEILPDLVVSAMYLPDMSGVDLIHAMRVRDDFEYTPFLLISSETNHQHLEPIRQAGVVGILPKPFEVDDLRRALYAAYDLCAAAHLRESFGIDFHKLQVLLVDDSVMSRNYIRRVIENFGVVHIDDAENGRQAMQLLAANHYDLLLTDYNMPEMDGQALLAFVRQESNQPNIPALMITSEQRAERLAALAQGGLVTICNKPFEPRVIGNLIQQVLACSAKKVS